MQLNTKRFALASGVLLGLALFVITLVAVGHGVGEHIRHLNTIYPGYAVSYFGSVIGFVYGFLTGAVAGFLFSVIYNGSLKQDSDEG